MITMVVLAIFGVFVLVLAVYGYKVSAKTAEDYMLAGRGIGIAVMFFFVVLLVGGFWLVHRYGRLAHREAVEAEQEPES